MLVWPLKAKKESGLLSVKVEGQERLVNIYFEQGKVVGITIGHMKNAACLDALAQSSPLESAFMKDCKVPDFVVAPEEDIKKLEALFALYPVTARETFGGKGTEVNVKADVLIKLERDFVEIIGPIGKMIVDAYCEEFGYKRGQDMPASLYCQLFEKLKADLPVQYQSAFAAKKVVGPGLTGKD
jgi:hypothetical protein